MAKPYVFEAEITALERMESLEVVDSAIKRHFRVQVHRMRVGRSIDVHEKCSL